MEFGEKAGLESEKEGRWEERQSKQETVGCLKDPEQMPCISEPKPSIVTAGTSPWIDPFITYLRLCLGLFYISPG